MYLSILVFFVIVNISLGILTISPSPLYVENNCFYPDETAPNVDPAIEITGSNMTSLIGETSIPTNSTVTDPLWGSGEPFNAITEPFEQSYKSLETVKNIVTGGFVVKVIKNVGLCVSGSESNPMWDYFANGLEIVIGIFVVIAVFYFITGRGGILSS